MIKGFASVNVPNVALKFDQEESEETMHKAFEVTDIKYGEVYLGYYKMVEECGELNTELGKLAICPFEPHYDGKGPVLPHVLDEMADLYAAMDYFLEVNEMQLPEGRREKKLAFFRDIVLTGLTTPLPKDVVLYEKTESGEFVVSTDDVQER